MKLQRVFSIDSSALFLAPNSNNEIIFKETVPLNRIWVVKNINYTTTGTTNFENSYFPTSRILLTIAINNTPLISQKTTSINLSVGDYGSTLINGPLIISGGKELKFLISYIRQIDSNVEKYRAHIYFSIEEYIVE